MENQFKKFYIERIEKLESITNESSYWNKWMSTNSMNKKQDISRQILIKSGYRQNSRTSKRSSNNNNSNNPKGNPKEPKFILTSDFTDNNYIHYKSMKKWMYVYLPGNTWIWA